MTKVEKIIKRPTVVSLFSGCGGFDLGFHNAGFNTLVMIEKDEDACATLRTNFTSKGIEQSKIYFAKRLKKQLEKGEISKGKYNQDVLRYNEYCDLKPILKVPGYIEPHILERDIKTVSSEEILKLSKAKAGEIDVVIGGPPCQGFSQANSQRFIDDPRNFLYKEFVRVVKDIQPKTFVMENVRGLVTMVKKGKIIRQIAKDFAECGYSIAWEVINCADYGIPQNRIRLIITGIRTGLRDIDEDLFNKIHGCMIHHDEKYEEKWKNESIADIKKIIKAKLPSFTINKSGKDKGDIYEAVASVEEEVIYKGKVLGIHTFTIISDDIGNLMADYDFNGETIEHNFSLGATIDYIINVLSGNNNSNEAILNGFFNLTTDGSIIIPFSKENERRNYSTSLIMEKTEKGFKAVLQNYPIKFNLLPKSILDFLEVGFTKIYS